MLPAVKPLIIVCAFSTLMACVPLNTVKPTTEQTRAVSQPNTILFAAALRYIDERDWTIESSEQGLGWIEAVSEVDDSAGMSTRERWIVSTRNGEIGIRLLLEFFNDGEWRSKDVVYDGYSYFRENMHLSGIANLAKDDLAAATQNQMTASRDQGAMR